METKAHPPGLQDVLKFPLIEALYGRRARRFSLGASIPDGPMEFTSRHTTPFRSATWSRCWSSRPLPATRGGTT